MSGTGKARYFTSADWVNRRGPVLAPWPPSVKKRGVVSHDKAGQAMKALLGIRKLERMGLLK